MHSLVSPRFVPVSCTGPPTQNCGEVPVHALNRSMALLAERRERHAGPGKGGRTGPAAHANVLLTCGDRPLSEGALRSSPHPVLWRQAGTVTQLAS